MEQSALPRVGYSVPEFAEAIGISRAGAYKWVTEGIIPTVRVGRRLIVPSWAMKQFTEQPEPSSTNSAS